MSVFRLIEVFSVVIFPVCFTSPLISEANLFLFAVFFQIQFWILNKIRVDMILFVNAS